LDVGIDGIFDVIKEGFGARITIGLPERFSFYTAFFLIKRIAGLSMLDINFPKKAI